MRVTEEPTRTAPRSPEGAAHGRMPVGTALAVVIGALITGSLLNAEPLANTASAQRPGPARDVAVAYTDAVSRISRAVGLDRPRSWIDSLRHDDAPDEPAVSQPREIFVPSREDPARLWVGGDSLVDRFGPAMAGAAGQTGVIEGRWEVRYSSGLARPMLFDWSTYIALDLGSDPADIAIFMVGANDAQPMLVGDEWVSFPGSEWQAEYRARVAKVMDLLTARAATVYWVGQPIAQSDRHSERIAVMNDIYRNEAAGRAGVRFIDSWELFSNAEGRYSAYLPDEDGARGHHEGPRRDSPVPGRRRLPGAGRPRSDQAGLAGAMTRLGRIGRGQGTSATMRCRVDVPR